MAKLSIKKSFTNAVIQKDDRGIFLIEEFDSKGENRKSKGKFNLTQILEDLVDSEGIKVSFDSTNELESDF